MKVSRKRTGSVHLVGAGPGDPDLITVKGAQCLEKADAVVYDRLVDPRLLDLAPPEAERIYVGKKGGHFTFSQEKINRLLVRLARRGWLVVRLKGGDPCLFGRGGEEALHLAAHAIPFEIVPGVTSALAAPTAAGIPITHRGIASSVAFVTGHQAKSGDQVNWRQLATAADTLVVLMPLGNLRTIVSQLVLHGRSLETPAAAIQAGTCDTQQQVFSPLRTIASAVERAGLRSPAVLVVGEAVTVGRVLGRLANPALRPESEFISERLKSDRVSFADLTERHGLSYNRSSREVKINEVS